MSSVEEEKDELSNTEMDSITAAIDEVKSKLETLLQIQTSIRDGIYNCKTDIEEAESDIPSYEEGSKIIEKYEKMLLEAELDYRTVELKVEDLLAAASKLAAVNNCETDEERANYSCETNNFDIDEKMKRLAIRLGNVQESFESVKKITDKDSKSKLKPLCPANIISADDREIIAKQLKALQRLTSSMTNNLDEIEDDMTTYNINQAKAKKEQSVCRIKAFAFPKNITTRDLDAENARQALRDLLLQQGPVQSKEAIDLPLAEFIPETKNESITIGNVNETLINSILQSPSRMQIINDTSKKDISAQLNRSQNVLDQQLKTPVMKSKISSDADSKPIERQSTKTEEKISENQPLATSERVEVVPTKPEKSQICNIATSVSSLSSKTISAPSNPVDFEFKVEKQTIAAKPSIFGGGVTIPTERKSIFCGGQNSSIFGETSQAVGHETTQSSTKSFSSFSFKPNETAPITNTVFSFSFGKPIVSSETKTLENEEKMQEKSEKSSVIEKPKETSSLFSFGKTFEASGMNESTGQKTIFGQSSTANCYSTFTFKPKEVVPTTTNDPSFSKAKGTSSVEAKTLVNEDKLEDKKTISTEKKPNSTIEKIIPSTGHKVTFKETEPIQIEETANTPFVDIAIVIPGVDELGFDESDEQALLEDFSVEEEERFLLDMANQKLEATNKMLDVFKTKVDIKKELPIIKETPASFEDDYKTSLKNLETLKSEIAKECEKANIYYNL